jgi:hypothetical protein
MTPMSSRQRMLASIRCQPVDHIPCSFMMYKNLLSNSRTYLDFIQRQLDLGLDAFVQVPERSPNLVSDTYNLHGLPVSFDPSVEVCEWKESIPGEKWPILIKEYHTPAGILRAEVRQDPEWPYADHVPFLDDYLEMRSRKFIIEHKEDLSALRYLLVPPTPSEVLSYQTESQPLIEFAQNRDLLLAGGWGVGADLIGWVFGLEKMIYSSYDDPNLLYELLDLIAEWNSARMKVVLSSGIDLYIKRAWYENCDFWSPKSWQKFILPILKADVDLAHQHNSLFGYLITSNAMPLLDLIVDSSVDVLIGIDPAKWDLVQTKAKTAGKICLWGGVNGHMTVEQGSVQDVEKEVLSAFNLFSPGGGLILSPVDNVRLDTPQTTENVQALIKMWRNYVRE